MPGRLGLICLLGLTAALAGAADGADVAVHSSGRYYQDASGKPMFLIGYYGWAAVPDGYYIDHPSRYSVMTTQGAPYKINYIRISLNVNRFTSSTNPPVWSGSPTPVPFLYVNGKSDLNQWDPAFWNGLKAQCQLAKDKGAIVHIAIFDGVELRPQGGAAYGYANSFWNPGNQAGYFYANPDANGNGGIEENGEFYRLADFNNNTGIGKYQRLLIDKAIAETAAFDNVFFEIGNELLSSPSSWNTAVIDYIRARTSKPVSQCGGSMASNQPGWSQHEADTPAQVKANVAAIVGAGSPAWEDPDGPALSDENVSADDLRRAAWYSFVGGAACWGGFTVDYWLGGRGFWTPTVTYYRNLQAFIESSGVRFWEMTPQHGLVSNSSRNSCLAGGGSEYVAYILNDATATLDLSGITGSAFYRTYDPKTGAFSAEQAVSGGAVRAFTRPAGADDWVIHVYTTVADGWDSLGAEQDLGSGTTPGVAVDSQGNIHVVYMSGGNIYYRKAAPNEVFGPAEIIPRPEGAQDYNSPHIVCDSGDVPHVIFDKDWYPRSFRTYYTNRIGGVWKTPVTVLDVDPATQLVIYPRLSLHGQYAYVGAMIGVDLGWIIRIKNLDTSPAVDNTVKAVNPLRSVAVTDSAGHMFAMGRYGANGHYFQEYDSDLVPVGGLFKWNGGTYGKTGSPCDAFTDRNGVVHMVTWGITGAQDICSMVYNNTQRRNPDGSFRDCITGLTGTLVGPDGTKPTGWWDEDVHPVVATDAVGRTYIAYREWSQAGEGKVSMIRNGQFIEPASTFASHITRRERWNCQMAPAKNGGVYVVWDDNGTVRLRSVGIGPGRRRPVLRVKEAASLITIDGSPADWNLEDFPAATRGGQCDTGDYALVGYDGPTLYYAGYHTGASLPTNPADHTARVYGRHDASYLYFLVRCDDSDVRCPYAAESMNWANDCVEFYIDPGGDGGSSPISNSRSDVQLVIDADNRKNVYMCADAYRAQVLSGVTSAVARDAAGWWLEVRVAKSALDPNPGQSDSFGVDFNFRDNDNNNDPAETTVYTWSDSSSGTGFPSKTPASWGKARLVSSVCFEDHFPYPDGPLNGSGGWTGSAAGQIAVENGAVKITGGAGTLDAIRTVPCDGGDTAAGMWARVRRGSGSYTIWSLRIEDPEGRSLARWYGMGTTARGRIGDGSQVTAPQSLTGGWDDLYVRIDFAANTSEFFFNGTPIGQLSHSEFGAGDSVGRLRLERIDNVSGSGNYVYLDDLAVGTPDTAGPECVIGMPSVPITRSGPVSYTVDFNEPVYGFSAASDIRINSTGSAAAGSVSVTGSGSGPYTVRLSGITGGGTLGISLKAVACTDVAGNPAAASGPSATVKVLDGDGSIAAAKLLGDGSHVELGGKALYLKREGFGYIEEPNRSCGIRVQGAIGAGEDESVCLSGTMMTGPGGERCILLENIIGGSPLAVRPVGSSNAGLGRDLMEGLFVRTWGRVLPGSVTADSFVISDGSGTAGISVLTSGAPEVSEGELVTVSGAAGSDGARVIYGK